MAFLRANALMSRLLCVQFWVLQAIAQYRQDYGWTAANNPTWTRQVAPQREVIITNNWVVLEYDCSWMPAICQNANQWLGLPANAGRPLMTHAGWTRATTAALNNLELFVHDMGGGQYSRGRRSQSCPTSGLYQFNMVHLCPEPAQPPVMGPPNMGLTFPNPWPVIALRGIGMPGGPRYEIGPANGHRSGRIYTCDEFPPASWVDGGVGVLGHPSIDAETRCAPMGCSKAGGRARRVNSEQNWQASAHSKLRATLFNQAQTNAVNWPIPGTPQSALLNRGVLFALRLRPAALGPGPHPAAVYTGQNPMGGIANPVNFRRQSGNVSAEPLFDFTDGTWSAIHIHHNGSTSETRPTRKRAPFCSGDSAATRRVAYYQASAARDRRCNNVVPAAINTTGLTHLIYSHLSFSNSTFQISPTKDDEDLLKMFTTHASNGLQTWVAIGTGDKGLAWEKMTATKGSRAAFALSLAKFMYSRGLQGVDLQWDNPGKAGAMKLALLVSEMFKIFQGMYGISVTLPADTQSLQAFPIKDMEAKVNFFGLKSWDLHGAWECDECGLGIQPHTAVADIEKALQPFWNQDVDPSKINLGVASYGRSYKLCDEACAEPGCICTGPGDRGSCTQTPGMLSQWEIQDLIADKGYVPQLNETAMVKSFAYDGDNWVSYDDQETIAMKQDYASSRCLGGLLDYSVDLQRQDGTGAFSREPSSNSTDLVYVSPEIWNQDNPEVICSYPCTLVLPPWTKTTSVMSIPSPITYSSANWTTTLQPSEFATSISVWWLSTMIADSMTTTATQSAATHSNYSTAIRARADSASITSLSSFTTAKPIITHATLFATPSYNPVVFFASDGMTHTVNISEVPPPATIQLPAITVRSGLPARTTTTAFATPCAGSPGLCLPGRNAATAVDDADCPDLQCDSSSSGDPWVADKECEEDGTCADCLSVQSSTTTTTTTSSSSSRRPVSTASRSGDGDGDGGPPGGGGGGGPPLIPCLDIPPAIICVACAIPPGLCWPDGSSPSVSSSTAATVTVSTTSGHSTTTTTESRRSSTGTTTLSSRSRTSSSSRTTSPRPGGSTSIVCPSATPFMMQCDSDSCSGFVRPSPMPTPGAFCDTTGCQCRDPSDDTPVSCPRDPLPCKELNVGCSGTMIHGTAICQSAYSGCPCEGYCAGNIFCNAGDCAGTPTSAGWGTCASGTASGCLCTSTLPPSTTIISTTSVVQPPAQTSEAVYIMLHLMSGGSESNNVVWQFAFFDGIYDAANPDAIPVDPCTAQHAYDAEDDEAPLDGHNNPILPKTDIGPLTSHGMPDCEYIYDRADEDAPGAFRCGPSDAGFVLAPCELSPQYAQAKSCLEPGVFNPKDDYTYAMICKWPS